MDTKSEWQAFLKRLLAERHAGHSTYETAMVLADWVQEKRPPIVCWINDRSGPQSFCESAELTAQRIRVAAKDGGVHVTEWRDFDTGQTAPSGLSIHGPGEGRSYQWGG